MSDPIVIWVVDDMKDEARDASEVVEEVASAFGGEFGVAPVVLWVDGFQWPPFANFRASVDPNAPCVSRNDYPSVVILDLFKPGLTGFKLEGDVFYYELRKWEMSKPARPSFVVPWSYYQGEEAAKQFIHEAEKNDQRLIPVPTKVRSLLKRTLGELWKRIVDERDAQ